MPITGLFRTLQFIYDHPLNREHRFRALTRFFKWQLGTRLLPYAVAVPFGEQSKLLMWRGLKGATQNLYCGLQEFEDMAFLLHFLRPGDQFVDVGANVGSYTVLAAGEVGADTISFEPIPATFKQLRKNIDLNEIAGKVRPMNVGLGSQPGVLHFTQHLDTTNHVVSNETADALAVEVKTFDDLIEISRTTLVKVDVEGFETEVLNGMSRALGNAGLQAMIVELNGSGKKYGYEDAAIHQKLLQAGFQAYRYFPFERKLELRDGFSTERNTIYIRDRIQAEQRLQSAKKININGRTF